MDNYEDEEYDLKILSAVLIVSLVLFFALIGCFLSKASADNLVQEVARSFLQSCARQELNKAKESAAGIVLFELENSKESASKAHIVVNINTALKSLGEDYAVVDAALETINPKNCEDVHWYTLYLIKKSTWKVYKIEEVNPTFESEETVRGNIQEQDITAAKNVFEDFCKLTLQKNYQEAGNCLIGKAKNSHERTQDIVKDIPVPADSVSIISSKLLLKGKDHLVLQIDYKITDKNLTAVVSCYRTGKGWKIYDISQV